MYKYAKVATLAVGLVVLAFGLLSSPAFTQIPIPPPCKIISVGIQGPSEGSVGQMLTFNGTAIGSNCADLHLNWTLSAAPAGAASWSATGEQVTLVPNVAGEYVIRLEITSGSSSTVLAKVDHKLTVTSTGAPPPSQPPSQPPSGGVQEFAIILGINNGALSAFPSTLNVAAGGVRLFLTSLDRSVTIILRLAGAQVGVATVLVESGKIATVEAQLSPGSYGLFDQSTNNQLGQIVAR